MAAIAAALSAPFMPHQRLIADVIGEYDPLTGLPYYDEAWILMNRRGGKTHTVLSFELDRCVAYGDRQVGAYTAQDSQTASKILLDDQVPQIKASPLWKAVRRPRRANGNVGLDFVNGSQIDVLSSSESAGHGRTFNFAIADEAFADTDARREAALLVPMSTVKGAQFVLISTAGTPKSTWLRSKVDMGRQIALEDRGSGVAYFEWSAPDDADPDDPETWWSCHPGLVAGLITEEFIANRRQSMDDGEFRRAYLNQWTQSAERVIPAESWDLVNRPDAAPNGRLVFGVDVAEDRASAAIVAVSADRVVELVEHRAGVAWLPDRCRELAASHAASIVAVDASGPSASFLPELEKLPGLFKMKGGDLAAASALFYDSVADLSVTVRRHPALDDAVASAARKVTGDRWMFARRGTAADQAPLVASVVGLWAVESGGSVDPVASVW